MTRDRVDHVHPADALCGFPTDEYTPHGYLANPFAVAHSWSEGRGGNLRSTDEAVGFGWVYPWARGARAGAQIEIGLVHDGGRLFARNDFERVGLTAPHHSALLFEYAWQLEGARCRARFVLVAEDELGLEVEVAGGKGTPLPHDEGTTERGRLFLHIAAVGWRRDDACTAVAEDDGDVRGSVDLGERFGVHRLIVEGDGEVRVLGAAGSMSDLPAFDQAIGGRASYRGGQVGVGVALPLRIGQDGSTRVYAVLRRGATGRPHGSIGDTVRTPVEAARRLDGQFWSGAVRLDGDWPDAWRRGWVYDLETTRMCISPPGGVFSDVWPA